MRVRSTSPSSISRLSLSFWKGRSTTSLSPPSLTRLGLLLCCTAASHARYLHADPRFGWDALASSANQPLSQHARPETACSRKNLQKSLYIITVRLKCNRQLHGIALRTGRVEPASRARSAVLGVQKGEHTPFTLQTGNKSRRGSAARWPDFELRWPLLWARRAGRSVMSEVRRLPPLVVRGSYPCISR